MRIVKRSELKEVKEELWLSQNKKCLICDKQIELDNSVVDHLHKDKKSDSPIPNGKGCIRGVLCNNCNRLEGKIISALKRFGQSNINLIESIKNYWNRLPTDLVYPTEYIRPVIYKSQFNKLLKLEPKAKYSKYGNKKLLELFSKHNIDPFKRS